jgi:hypothetical protein
MWCNAVVGNVARLYGLSLKEGQFMSRVVTPPQQTSPGTYVKVPHEKIAMRAYEKWCKRGCAHGHDQQDWLEAEAELRSEMLRTAGTMPTQPRR